MLLSRFPITIDRRRKNALSGAIFRCLLIGLAAPFLRGAPASAHEHVSKDDIHPERELLITAPAIVDSAAAQYPGPWSFGGLIEALAGEEKASACVREWLESWNQKNKVNELEMEARYDIYRKVIRPLQERDGYQFDSAGPWEPQLKHAPFRLLAIVNRMDLCAPNVAGVEDATEARWQLLGRDKLFKKLLEDGVGKTPPASFGYGFCSLLANANSLKPDPTAGEGRFVFGAVDQAGAPLEGGWTIILEYKLSLKSPDTTVREWANAWHALGSLSLSDPAYPVALEKLTRRFTHGPSVSLSQLRSSEAAFGSGREFRQFDFGGGSLSPAALTRTPAPAFAAKNSPEHRALDSFIREQEVLIRSGIENVPVSLPEKQGSLHLLGGAALIPANDSNFHWDLSGISHETRRLFSLNTCNGCHGGETGCSGGMHIRPRAAGEEAVLSRFLRTDGQPLRVNDPEIKGLKVTYEEMEDRAAILAALLEPNDSATNNDLRLVLRDRLSRAH